MKIHLQKIKLALNCYSLRIIFFVTTIIFATCIQLNARGTYSSLRFIEFIYYRLYPAGMNFVSISLTTLRSTQWAIKKNPVPVVKPGTKKQLIFLNFSVRGNRYIEQIQFVQSFDMKYRSICVHFVVPVIQVIDYEL